MVKRAVLCGCNYPGTNAELRGCINDVWTMKEVLTKYLGFTEENITVLIDTDKSYMQPTGKNMKAKLSEMVAAAADGDELFLHFSGHGTQIPSADGDEKDNKDEAICPCDMNVITDDDLRVLLKPLEAKPGVKFTFVADCCHSGTLLDHETVQISGPKPGSAPPPALDGVLGAFLTALGDQSGRDLKNRALPFTDLCSVLSSMLGGVQVDARSVRSNLGTIFGADSSAKIQTFVGLLNQFTNQQPGAKAGTGGQASTAAAVGGLLSCLMSCLQPPPAPADANSAPAAHAAAAGGTTTQSNPNYAAAAPAAGNLAEPDLKINLPPAGAKPPADQRLGDDVGILITGCQSNETSADACPSGDPSKAHGALSNAIRTVLDAHYTQTPGQHITYRNLVVGVRELLGKTGFTQNPCLECSDKNADTPFIVKG
ncbi:hypothetical protein HYH03_002145 [Edaphochlamys debaryana]|uniref:Peptidase C14 caspase domain-containing protein n=1 Tax=Edaphochlamys debaryana TaxID=47281 RepID=A0A836C5H9_9CHLO|nr:hypothetical protein HYH03_002145 [Edaphochlamys debaryana]|eukprot:KAG2499854.1 hypothetical protein HYH03_002145 [Edaphochlamys debaryana]